MRRRKLLAVGLVGLIAAIGLIAAYFDALVIAALKPRVAFDPARVPVPPDYARGEHWSALPERVDADDVAIAGLAAIEPASAAVDVFYVHPTSFVGRDWNATMGDATVDAATDRGATRIQATAFRGCCAVYAPRYRQANLAAFTHPTEDGQRAIGLAGEDVIAAFRWYLARAGGRPFIVAGHSQGAVHAFRVLRDVVVREGLQDRLVAAYLIGGPLTDAGIAELGLPVCAAAGQTGCVIGFNARSADYAGGLDFVEWPPAPPGTPARPRVCVNPLTWRRDEAPGERALHRGAVFFDGDVPPAPRAEFTSARCRGGWLVVEFDGAVPRDFMSRILDYAIGSGNYHPIEFGLFFVDLRDDAAGRVRAYLDRRPS